RQRPRVGAPAAGSPAFHRGPPPPLAPRPPGAPPPRGVPPPPRRGGRPAVRTETTMIHNHPLVGAGLPVWLPSGAAARHAVEEYIREQERLEGYQHVYSPPLGKREMFRKSGHLAKFGDDMFPAMPDGSGDESDELMLRPSMCP